MSEVTPAATVLLLREGVDGVEVFLVKRHRRSGFMPRMWVFPGGRVEPADGAASRRIVGGEACLAAFDDPAVGRGTLVAAVRETFEESGLWLGEGELPQDLRAPLDAGEVALAQVLEDHDERIDLDVLHPWARWVTPEGEGRRFDAAFLVAASPEGEGSHCARETVDSGWYRPADVLAAGLDVMGLAPPTFWVLTQLARLGTLDAVLEATRTVDLRPVQPVLARGETGFAVLLPGHEGHPLPARDDVPHRIGMTPDGWALQGDPGQR